MENFKAMPRDRVKAHRKYVQTKVLRLIERKNFESESGLEAAVAVEKVDPLRLRIVTAAGCVAPREPASVAQVSMSPIVCSLEPAGGDGGGGGGGDDGAEDADGSGGGDDDSAGEETSADASKTHLMRRIIT